MSNDARGGTTELTAVVRYAAAMERLRRCRRAVAAAARDLSSGDREGIAELEALWRQERAQLFVVQDLRRRVQATQRHAGLDPDAARGATVLRMPEPRVHSC